jgi:signal transduction histidine kinase
MTLLNAPLVEQRVEDEALVRETFNSLTRLIPILLCVLILSALLLSFSLWVSPRPPIIISVVILLSVMSVRVVHWFKLRGTAYHADLQKIRRELRRFAILGPAVSFCFAIVGFYQMPNLIHQPIALMSIWVAASVSAFGLFYMPSVAALITVAACVPLCLAFLLSKDTTLMMATPFFAIITGFMIYLLRENFQTFAGIINSRTRLEAARENLVKAMQMAEAGSQAKTRFLANMSHELRTPLNAIIGFGEIIRGEIIGPIGDKRYQEYGADICDAACHLLEILSDVLDMAKIESGQIELDIEEIELREIVLSALSMIKQQAEAKRIRIAAMTSGQEPVLRTDARSLKQILINLLSNAVKFTADGGSIAIEAAIDIGGALVVKIIDTGIGIAAKDIERVFEPFEQASLGVAKTHGGSGLGLAISRRLAREVGAELSLESQLDIGTTAILRFPAPLVVNPGPGLHSKAS